MLLGIFFVLASTVNGSAYDTTAYQKDLIEASSVEDGVVGAHILYVMPASMDRQHSYGVRWGTIVLHRVNTPIVSGFTGGNERIVLMHGMV